MAAHDSDSGQSNTADGYELFFSSLTVGEFLDKIEEDGDTMLALHALCVHEGRTRRQMCQIWNNILDVKMPENLRLDAFIKRQIDADNQKRQAVHRPLGSFVLDDGKFILQVDVSNDAGNNRTFMIQYTPHPSSSDQSNTAASYDLYLSSLTVGQFQQTVEKDKRMLYALFAECIYGRRVNGKIKIWDSLYGEMPKDSFLEDFLMGQINDDNRSRRADRRPRSSPILDDGKFFLQAEVSSIVGKFRDTLMIEYTPRPGFVFIRS